MLKSMSIRNLTVFANAEIQLAPNLNVFVGENGAGKTHLLKLAYSVIWVAHAESRRARSSNPTKSVFQTALADKLVSVFRAESLGRLARRRPGRERCDIELNFRKQSQSIEFGFATNSRSEVNIVSLPSAWIDSEPTFLPTRELLSVFPGFVSLYEGHYVEYDETWRDTCLLLGRPLKRGPRESSVSNLLEPLEEAMGGTIDLDKRTGHFYLVTSTGRMEIPLVAEGLRKLGMLARLIATGALLEKGYLFWDEPEANLNPKLIKQVAKTIIQLSEHGIQVFIATHSLFLLRELEILLLGSERPSHRFFGLHCSREGVSVMQGPSVGDIGQIASLEEELQQSDRLFEAEAKITS